MRFHALLLLGLFLAPAPPRAALLRERCSWSGLGDLDDSVMTPVVVDLDGDGLSEVAVLVLAGERSPSGRLVVLSGADCSMQLAVPVLGCRTCVGETTCTDLDAFGDGLDLYWSGLAAADLDGDGRPELVAMLESSRGLDGPERLVALRGDGSFLWCSEALPDFAPGGSPLLRGILSVADLDADGSPEIVAGSKVFSAVGRLLCDDRTHDGTETHSVAVDADADGDQDLLHGGALLDAGCSPLWNRADLMAPHPLGIVLTRSIGVDLEGDGRIEVIVPEESSRLVHVLDGSGGMTRASAPMPPIGGGCSPSLGPPAAGDLDGDGVSEVVVSSGNRLCAFDWSPGPPEALAPRWCIAIDDCSSGNVTPAIADLDGDGAGEVLLRDERALRVVRGDGTLLQVLPANSTTASEGPAVADLDGDCSGEVIFTGDDVLDLTRPHAAVTILEGDDAPIAGQRPVWNQAAFDAAGVLDDGRIPPIRPLPRSFHAQEAGGGIATVTADRTLLWPPNHRMVRVGLASDDGSPVRVLRVLQDEPVDDRGDGSHGPDAVVDASGLRLRAERDGRGDGRTYHVEVETGPAGCSSFSFVTVCVPHDRRPGRRGPAASCGDQGALFDSLIP